MTSHAWKQEVLCSCVYILVMVWCDEPHILFDHNITMFSNLMMTILCSASHINQWLLQFTKLIILMFENFLLIQYLIGADEDITSIQVIMGLFSKSCWDDLRWYLCPYIRSPQFSGEHHKIFTDQANLWGLVCQKQASRTCISNYIPQHLWDVITYTCQRCLVHISC